MRKVQFVVTGISLAAAGAHLAWPSLAIDTITLVLLLFAGIPWLVPLFKSLELPGGLKVEFQDFEEATERAEDAGLIDDEVTDISRDTAEYSFQEIADLDPNLALAGLRIEIERRLVNLAEAGGVNVPRRGIGHLLKELGKRDLLNRDQRTVLEDIIGLLNAAAHGDVKNYLAARWALDVGPKLIQTLDKQIAEVSRQ